MSDLENKCNLGAGRVKMPKLLLLAGVCVGLSACVSSIFPVAQLDDVADNKPNEILEMPMDLTPDDGGEQLLVQIADGTSVPIPVRNPQLTVAALPSSLSNSGEVQNPDANSGSVEVKPKEQAALLAAIDNPAQKKTGELALAMLQESPNTVAGRLEGDANGIAPQTPQVTAAKSATQEQAGAALKKPSFFARLFQRPKKNVGPSDDRKNSILLSSRTASQSNRVTNTPSTASLQPMPGVRSNDAIFGINRQTGGAESNVQVASVAGMARLSPLALRVQHAGVDVGCIRPEVLQLVQFVERRYGKKPIVTSAYRSPSRNRRAGGARNSMHIYCKAVDIQVEGVSKWDLAKFMRTIPGRGGVGTYCRTRSVHIDSGIKRDWHQSCRRKSKRRRKT